MRLLGRSGRTRQAGRKAARRRAPSFREMRARLRTEKAEARLLETQARIHQEAARIRVDLRSRG
ncbi:MULTISPECIES: hypothetical protein [Actinomadura]|uniref:Uncharacterized protein n=1 Tax=Actinomadura miaoliensis TaxID=430685 RepID=A0ABP7WJF6_9ACTN